MYVSTMTAEIVMHSSHHFCVRGIRAGYHTGDGTHDGSINGDNQVSSCAGIYGNYVDDDDNDDQDSYVDDDSQVSSSGSHGGDPIQLCQRRRRR